MKLGAWIAVGVAMTSVGLGCDGTSVSMQGSSSMDDTVTEIPVPISLLLPKTLEMHPFTRAGALEEGHRGVLAHVQAKDAYGDPTKAFGKYRFELYSVRPDLADRKGLQLASWDSSVWDPETNLLHWDRHTRSYAFKLGWDRRVAPGTRLLLVTSFDSPYTSRITTRRELVVGE